MRIIAGSAKGRNIASVASSTRPTSDRAREALFSTLASEFGEFEGLNVLDLYAGTGAIALESLSRGAALVHAVEKDEQAQKSIASNYEAIKSAQCPGTFHLYGMSVHRFLQDPPIAPYHFIYIDPPYEVENTEVEKILKKIFNLNLLNKFGVIAIERDAKGKTFSWPEGFSELKVRSYGAGAIHYGVLTERNL